MPKFSTKFTPRTETSQETKNLQKQRTSTTFIQAFDSEKSANQIVADLESHPLFEKLIKNGVIEKKAFMGRVPKKNVVEFLNKRAEKAYEVLRYYGLDNHQDLVAASYCHNKAALKRILTDAERQEIPKGEIEDALRDIARAHVADDRNSKGITLVDPAEMEERANLQGNSPEMSYPFSAQEMEPRFCEELHVSEQVFHHYFYADDAQKLSEVDIAEKLDCPAQTVINIRAYLSNALVIRDDDETSEAPTDGGYIATIFSTPDGWDVRMPKEYELYIVSRHVDEFVSKKELDEWRKLESKIRAINERTNRREQAIRFICRHQSAYLATNDIDELAPLSQGEIARAIGCHPDRVSRLLFDDDHKDETKMHRKKSRQNRSSDSTQHDESDEYQPGPRKFITTPNGRIFLRDLLCGLDKVVSRLAKLHPDYSDAGIAKLILEKFDVHRTRSAVHAARKRGSKLRPSLKE